MASHTAPFALALVLAACVPQEPGLDNSYAQCTGRTTAPYNYPLTSSSSGDSMSELYDTLRIAELWDRGYTGRGYDVYILDSSFTAPVNAEEMSASYKTTGFEIRKTLGCGVFYECKFQHLFAAMPMDELPQSTVGSQYPHGTWVAQVAAGSDLGIDVCWDPQTFAGIAPEASLHYFQVPGAGFAIDGPVREEGPGGVVLQAIQHIQAQGSLSKAIIAIDYVGHNWERGQIVSEDDIGLVVSAVDYARRRGAVVLLSSKYFGADTSPPNPGVVDAVKRVLDAGAVVTAPYYESQIHIWDRTQAGYQGSLEVFKRLARPFNRYDSNSVAAVAGLVADLWQANPSLNVTDFAPILADASQSPQSTDVGNKVPLDAVVALEAALAR